MARRERRISAEEVCKLVGDARDVRADLRPHGRFRQGQRHLSADEVHGRRLGLHVGEQHQRGDAIALDGQPRPKVQPVVYAGSPMSAAMASATA